MSKKSVSNTVSSDLSYDDMCKIIRGIKSSSATLLGEKEIVEFCQVSRHSTGVPTVDFLTSGGLTIGRITILAGNISSGKTTFTLQLIASMQKRFAEENKKKMILYYDPEGSYDVSYAKALGIDQNFMIIKRTRVIEDAFDEMDTLVSTGLIGMLIIDSLDGMIARKVDDSDYGNSMGGTAGAVAMHLPKLYSKLLDHNITTIFIKQARVKLGGYAGPSGAEILTFSGGKALRHFADSIFIMNRLSNKNLEYTPVKIKAEKTRSSRMGLTLEIPIGNCGIDPVRDLVNIAITHGVVTQSGCWLIYTKDNVNIKSQGTEKLIALLRENQEYLSVIKKDIYDNIISISSIVGNSSEDNDMVLVDD